MSVPVSIIQYKLKQIITARLEVMWDKEYIKLNMLGITRISKEKCFMRNRHQTYQRDNFLPSTKERPRSHLCLIYLCWQGWRRIGLDHPLLQCICMSRNTTQLHYNHQYCCHLRNALTFFITFEVCFVFIYFLIIE